MARQRRMNVLLGLILFCVLSCQSKREESKVVQVQDLKFFATILDPKASASERVAFAMARVLNDPVWEKRWWIEKTVRVLRGGQSLRPDEDIAALEGLSEDQLIDKLMADPAFPETMLDFNMYFLGFKIPSVRADARVAKLGYHFSPEIFEFPTAIRSVQELMKGGDYFHLLKMTAPAYASPLEPPTNLQANEMGLPADEVRTKRIEAFNAVVTDSIEKLKNDPNVNTPQVCGNIFEAAQRAFSESGFPLMWVIRTQIKAGFFDFMTLCQRAPAASATELLPAVQTLHQWITIFVNQFIVMDLARYNPKSLADIQLVDTVPLGLEKEYPFPGLLQAVAIGNSSTNANRRRSAYILKHFFCDDLNPVGVAAPESHTSGEHGSETSCFACHYKLDPMAGFFRDYGVIFTNFASSPVIVFDDQAVQQRDEYNKQWKSKSTSRVWDVGYVRSTTDEKLNAYGESLEDLSRIIREAPEVKRCVVRRLFEYFVAENQTVDAGYVSHLADMMAREASVNSSTAIKNTIRTLVKSQSYRDGNMDPNKCYDFAPGTAMSSLPCRVAYLLEHNCKSCHSSASAKGGLDLTQWLTLADGTQNFPHVDASGAQQTVKQTFNEILRRLSTSDPEERMPNRKEISSQDLQEIYLWAQETLSNAK